MASGNTLENVFYFYIQILRIDLHDVPQKFLNVLSYFFSLVQFRLKTVAKNLLQNYLQILRLNGGNLAG